MSIATETPTKLDLACGQNKQKGYFGIDIAETEDTDLVHDLSEFPWPFESDSVEAIYSSHYVEHTYPVGGPNDGLIAFMNEVYRICEDGAKVEIIHPYLMSKRAFQDPTHTRYIPEATWWYFNLEWRKQNKLDHYPITANFDIDSIANGWTQGWEVRSDVARNEHAERSWNIITDLAVTLRVVK